MDSKPLVCLLIFHLLIVQGTCNDINNDAEMQEKMAPDHDSQSSAASGRMIHDLSMDPGFTSPFLLDDLKVGKEMRLLFPNGDPNPLSSPYLWSKEDAEAVPFSLAQLPQILQHFSIPQGSRKAQVIEETLRHCEEKPPMEEEMVCVTSYESLVDFVKTIFGSDTADFQLLSTRPPTRSTAARLQNYKIVQAPERVFAPKTIACHPFNYPYMVFKCHHLKVGNNRIFTTFLQGQENGEMVEAIAMCHMDTSIWSPDNPFFPMLGVQPGHPICHFFPTEHFVLIPAPIYSSS